jgi:probable F420-dependent oxidoreductase
VTVDAVREFAREAERLGFSSLWVQDHFLWPLEPRRGYAGRAGVPVPPEYQTVLAPTELLAAVATWTERVTLGTSILVAGNHWPVPLAQRLATVDVLSNGRLVVGLGVGWNAEEHDASGTDIRTRGARMDDFVDALRACWGPDPVSHEGPFFTIPPSIMNPKPVQKPEPPLISGMWSDAGLERTRDRFDAWNPAGRTVQYVVDTVAQLNAAREAGRPPLAVYHRAFVQRPNAPPPEADPVALLTPEAKAASEAGFTEFIVEHNFWTAIKSPDDWVRVPEQFAPLLDVVRAG